MAGRIVPLKAPSGKKGRKRLIRMLLHAPVSQVRFRGDKVFLNFAGHRISDDIVVKRERHVADWSRRRKEVFIDRNISGRDREKSFRALCVHEAVEKFLAEKFGLIVDREADAVARRKEREYLEKNGGNWRSHELIVYWDWHHLGEE